MPCPEPVVDWETARRRVSHQALAASALLRVARFVLGRSGSAGQPPPTENGVVSQIQHLPADLHADAQTGVITPWLVTNQLVRRATRKPRPIEHHGWSGRTTPPVHRRYSRRAFRINSLSLSSRS